MTAGPDPAPPPEPGVRLFPTQRGVAALLAWTGLSLLAVPVPPLDSVVAVTGLLLIGLGVWDAAVLWRLAGPTFRRLVPERAAIGCDSEIALEIASRDDVRLELDVFEELPRDLADDDPEFRGVALAPRARVPLAYTLRPSQRGRRPLGRVALLLRTPLGLMQRRFLFPGDALHVYPDTSGLLSREALDPRRRLAALGVVPGRPRGSGLEFETLREYVSGDDVRFIDWRATARRGRTMTRVYRHERDHPLLLALDTSRLMGASCGRATALDFAIESLLALAYTALHHGDRVGVAIFDSELRGYVAPRRSRRALGRLIDEVHDVQTRVVEPDYARLARELARRQRQHALVVVLTDFAHPAATGLLGPLAILARQHRVLLVALRNPLLDGPAGGGSAPDDLDLYRRLVVDDLIRERELALAELRQHRVLTLDLAPSEVTPPLLNRYLALRFGEG